MTAIQCDIYSDSVEDFVPQSAVLISCAFISVYNDVINVFIYFFYCSSISSSDDPLCLKDVILISSV